MRSCDIDGCYVWRQLILDNVSNTGHNTTAGAVDETLRSSYVGDIRCNAVLIKELSTVRPALAGNGWPSNVISRLIPIISSGVASISVRMYVYKHQLSQKIKILYQASTEKSTSVCYHVISYHWNVTFKSNSCYDFGVVQIPLHPASTPCSLSLLQAVDPSGEGSATRVLFLHSARFLASSTLSYRSSMLCLTTSIHLFLCLPLLRCPPTFASKIRLTQSFSSRRCICPYHLSAKIVSLHLHCICCIEANTSGKLAYQSTASLPCGDNECKHAVN